VFKLVSGDAETTSRAVLQPGGGESRDGRTTSNEKIDKGAERSSVPEQEITPPVEPS
jgi:hypothetical protein